MKSPNHLLVLLGVSLLGSFLNAQQASSSQSAIVPRLVNFSGKATDPQGKAVAGIAGVTFAIYQEQYEGAPLWLETQNVQADAKGNYSVQLGATKPNGLPLDLFSSGEARWLGVSINGGQEQPRVLLLSVPYALKAADAQTLGGLPASAFVLAAPPSNNTSSAPVNPASSTSASSALPPNPAVTGAGSSGFLPLWDTSSDIVNSVLSQSGSGATAKVGINTTTPASTLDVKGSETVRGNLSLPATASATASAGKNSQPTTFTASAFNSGTRTAMNQNFRLQAEPAGNNTASTSGTLNLLYAAGSNPLAETGLKIGSTGHIAFAPGQTFPGTVTSVGLSASSSDFTVSGSPVTNSGTLNLSWKIAPTSNNTANAIVKRDGTGSFSAGGISATNTGNVIVATMGGNTAQTAAVTGTATATGVGNTYGVAGYSATGNGVGLFGQNTGNGFGVYALSAGASPAIWGESSGAGPVSDGVHGVTSSGGASGVAGVNNGGGIGVYGTGGTGVFGTGSGFGFVTDSNVQQARSAGGWVKAMVYVNGMFAPYTIVRCFNSTLSGAAASTPPCGINFQELATGIGHWSLNFGFEVDDRFYSTTLGEQYDIRTTIVAAASLSSDPNSVYVDTVDSSGNGKGNYFTLIVF